MSSTSNPVAWFWIFAVMAILSIMFSFFFNLIPPTTQQAQYFVLMVGFLLDIVSTVALLVLLYLLAIKSKT